MRLISDDGTVNLPYERVAVILQEDDEELGPCWTIRAFDTADSSDSSWVMGCFFDEFDAKAEMDRILMAGSVTGRAFYKVAKE